MAAFQVGSGKIWWLIVPTFVRQARFSSSVEPSDKANLPFVVSEARSDQESRRQYGTLHALRASSVCEDGWPQAHTQRRRLRREAERDGSFIGPSGQDNDRWTR